MLVRFTRKRPDEPTDTLTCVRTDGSSTSQPMRRRGFLPRDVIRFVVETTLDWHDSHFGLVARGESFEQIAALLKPNAGTRRVQFTQILQCESLVECLEAEQWGGPADPAGFVQNLLAACRRRAVSPPDITAEELERVRVALREFGAAWRPLADGASLERTF